MNPIKQIILAIILALAPILFSFITKEFPDFPLDQGAFVALIVWVVGLLVGGWNLKAAVHKWTTIDRIDKHYHRDRRH